MLNETVMPAEDGGHDEMLRQLDVLYERTTQGSWRTYQNGVHPVEVGGMGSGDDYAICTHGPKSFANADWIATMHDEWPGIRAHLEAQAAELAAKDAEIDRLKRGLMGAAMFSKPDSALTTERAAHAETRRERDEALKALEQIAVIEPVSNCDAGSMARSRMRDIARYSIARRPK